MVVKFEFLITFTLECYLLKQIWIKHKRQAYQLQSAYFLQYSKPTKHKRFCVNFHLRRHES